jgi:hypothetical protein
LRRKAWQGASRKEEKQNRNDSPSPDKLLCKTLAARRAPSPDICAIRMAGVAQSLKISSAQAQGRLFIHRIKVR